MIRDTRYIFFGTPRFAAIILEKLISAGIPPVALVCNPDRPTGRKKIITPPPTKQVVREKVASSKGKIEIFQPENLKDAYYLLHATNYDVFIVAAYSKILPREILAIPRLGTIGVHPSLLPKYRGPSPIQSAILAGETETGITLFLMDEQVDNGPIISSKKLVVSSKDNYETL
ncbi:MAG: methionyl-tRNA formyltransferase, partial [Candidatus Colwellbacteria bacterium]|nr:methionyl-tRNA formyltransferase [Candidatus Colwellbacteria bacterium]